MTTLHLLPTHAYHRAMRECVVRSGIEQLVGILVSIYDKITFYKGIYIIEWSHAHHLLYADEVNAATQHQYKAIPILKPSFKVGSSHSMHIEIHVACSTTKALLFEGFHKCAQWKQWHIFSSG